MADRTGGTDPRQRPKVQTVAAVTMETGTQRLMKQTQGFKNFTEHNCSAIEKIMQSLQAATHDREVQPQLCCVLWRLGNDIFTSCWLNKVILFAIEQYSHGR